MFATEPCGDVEMIETVWLDNPPVNAVNAGIIETLWTAFENLAADVERGRPARQGRARVLGGRRHHGLRRRRRRRRPPGGHPAGRRPDRGGARAGRRGDPRLLPRRWARDRARVRLPDRDARRAARLPRGEPRAAARRRRHAARAAADLARPCALADDVGRADHARRPAAQWGLVEFVVDDLEGGIAQLRRAARQAEPARDPPDQGAAAATRATSAATSARCRRSRRASTPRTGRRASPRSSRSGRPTGRGRVKAVVLREVGGDARARGRGRSRPARSSTCAPPASTSPTS